MGVVAAEDVNMEIGEPVDEARYARYTAHIDV